LQKYLDDYNFTMIESNLEGQAVRSAGWGNEPHWWPFCRMFWFLL
jgi:hypothetical protein